MTRLSTLVAACLAVGLASCSHFQPAEPISGAALVRAANGDEMVMAAAMDATVESLVALATDPSGDPVVTDKRGAGRGQLTRLASGAFVVRLPTLLDPAGNQRFVGFSGAFSVAPSGVAVASWPTASATQALGTAHIAFDQGPVVWTDPATGNTATVSTSGVDLAFASTYTYTSLGNWTITIDAAITQSQAQPFAETSASANDGTNVCGSWGYRHVQLVETRTTGGGVNTLSVQRTVDGNGLPGDPPGGTVGADPQAPSVAFTVWNAIVIDTQALTTNRYLQRTTTFDYTTTPATVTVVPSADAVMVNGVGVAAGPISTAQELATFAATPPQ
jgi:hypothetical protein